MDTDTLNTLVQIKYEMESLIRKYAKQDVHFTGKQSEPEICDNYVRCCTYEDLLEEGGALDELFDILKEGPFDEVRCEKRQEVIEAREEEDFTPFNTVSARYIKNNVG